MVSLLVLLVASVVVGVATAALELADFGRVQAIHGMMGDSDMDHKLDQLSWKKLIYVQGLFYMWWFC